MRTQCTSMHRHIHLHPPTLTCDAQHESEMPCWRQQRQRRRPSQQWTTKPCWHTHTHAEHLPNSLINVLLLKNGIINAFSVHLNCYYSVASNASVASIASICHRTHFCHWNCQRFCAHSSCVCISPPATNATSQLIRQKTNWVSRCSGGQKIMQRQRRQQRFRCCEFLVKLNFSPRCASAHRHTRCSTSEPNVQKKDEANK